MSVAGVPTRQARTLPFVRSLARHARTPVHAFEEASAQASGELVRLNMGPFRPYLITHPDHVQHVLKTNQPNYIRAGMFWDPLAPLLGQGILSDGEGWAASRKILQPVFTARYVNSLTESMAGIVTELIDAVVAPGRPLDIAEVMSAVIHPTIVRLFLGATISDADIDRLAPAYDTGVTARSIRLLLPFVPQRFPLPGDGAFKNAIRTIDDVVYPRIHYARARGGDADLVSRLCRAREGEPGADRLIRDDMVAIHGAATETSVTALTWVWPVLDAHPAIAAKVYEEIDRVVGRGPVTMAHLAELTYLRMFVDELVRLYPPGWILPRTVVRTDEIDGVEVAAGSTVVLSPFLTHRLPEFWDRPLEFDPERFAAGGANRHRYAYFPFAAGPHVCLGPHLFLMEALLVIAGILAKYRPVLHGSGPVTPRLASTLRPATGLTMTLVPASRA
ncbi:cytochrome P450 [Nonomuraea sp. K274]|uniref:Cytochrome P450 n=1 Tax=Nonomuraea cypriaca TaxID=1187855 RepID=A0A931F175_9ACTN|nr:cytochrome P450 [Nonomuraea cypriaca]MBF8189307.1 cytochrome P450 [Nonomuraea cypriaca]